MLLKDRGPEVIEKLKLVQEISFPAASRGDPDDLVTRLGERIRTPPARTKAIIASLFRRGLSPREVGRLTWWQIVKLYWHPTNEHGQIGIARAEPNPTVGTGGTLNRSCCGCTPWDG